MEGITKQRSCDVEGCTVVEAMPRGELFPTIWSPKGWGSIDVSASGEKHSHSKEMDLCPDHALAVYNAMKHPQLVVKQGVQA